MHGFFDIHSHILPGIDDGARSMEETRHMLLLAYEEGIRFVVATPHYIAGKSNIKLEYIKEIFEQVTKIAADVSKEFLILLGNELYYNTILIDALNQGKALTIDNTRYILLEFKVIASFREIWEGLNSCIFAGYIPILAHAERYRCLTKDPNLVGDLIKLGAYIQLNFSCITEHIQGIEHQFSRKLLQNGWVHFLGTDAHGVYERAPKAKDAVAFLERKYGVNTAQMLLWENPMSLVENVHLKI